MKVTNIDAADFQKLECVGMSRKCSLDGNKKEDRSIRLKEIINKSENLLTEWS